MLRSMYSAIAGMKANQTKLDVVANNIANVSTTAFKSSKVNFSDTLYQSSSQATAATTNLGGTNAKSVGLGAKVSSVNKLMTTGNALTTGRTLDLCIDGEGYLVVSKGAIDSEVTVPGTGATNTISANTSADTVYTRNGNLSLDADGNLVTSDGYRVMGYYATGTSYDSGTDTIIANGSMSADSTTYETTKLNPLAIPDSITPDGASTAEAVSAFSIGTDGVITVTTSSGKYAIGQIAMATFKNPEGLQDLGNSYAQVSSNSGDALISTSNTVSSTDSNSSAFGSIKSGYLEASNVDLTEQFTEMITATRSFQAASKMITNGDEILQTITGLIR